MPLASNNERTATVEVTRPSERLVSPFHGSERLMTLLELSQLLRRAGSHALPLASPR
jgi:hypothetical protein